MSLNFASWNPLVAWINDTAVSTVAGISKSAVFTVSLHHPSASPVSVNFTTRDGTARAATTTFPGSYFASSGTLTIPANTLSGTIAVPISRFGGGTFFVALSNPVNGTIEDGTGRATSTIITLTIRSFDLDPDAARVAAGDRVEYALTWTVPPDRVWRNLSTLDFRLRWVNHTAMWLRWDEAGDTFRLCESTGTRGQGNAGEQLVTCGPAFAAGSAEVPETPQVRLYLADTRVVGSGPTGQSVTLYLSLEFLDPAAGHRYPQDPGRTTKGAMYRHDYIIRLIERFGVALRSLRDRILRRERDVRNVRVEIGEIAQQAGLDLAVARSLTPEMLLLWLAPTAEPDPAKLWLMGELLYSNRSRSARPAPPGGTRISDAARSSSPGCSPHGGPATSLRARVSGSRRSANSSREPSRRGGKTRIHR